MIEDERELIIQAQNGDANAFGKLYDHYLPPLYRFVAVKVSVRQEAEDLIHEVFLQAWQKLPTYEQKGFPFSSWLYRIARNKVIDHYRSRKQHASLDESFDTIAADPKLSAADSGHQKIDIALSFDEVRAAMLDLTADQQDVLILRFVEDLTPAEIAIVLGKREGAVRIIQHRALQQLKKQLGPNALDSLPL